jgi:transposase-like protein
MTKVRKSKYSEETKQSARTFVKEGKSIREISNIMEIPCQNIRYWVRNLTITNTNRYSKVKRQEVIDLFQKEDLSIAEIVAKTSVPYASVYYWVKKSGGTVKKAQKKIVKTPEVKKVPEISKSKPSKPQLTKKDDTWKLVVGGSESANIVVVAEEEDDIDITLETLEKFEESLALSVKIKAKEEVTKNTFDFWGAVAKKSAGENVVFPY